MNNRKNFKKTFVNFSKLSTDCENVEMRRNFNGNLWKFYKKEKLAES